MRAFLRVLEAKIKEIHHSSIVVDLVQSCTFFFKNTPWQVYKSYKKDNVEDRQSAVNKRWQLLKYKDYSPPNNGNGSTRPKESLRKSLA
jgi:hypothetical protein